LAIIKYLAEIRPQSLNDVLLGSKPLKAATAVAAETEVEAQVRKTEKSPRACYATYVFSLSSVTSRRRQLKMKDMA